MKKSSCHPGTISDESLSEISVVQVQPMVRLDSNLVRQAARI